MLISDPSSPPPSCARSGDRSRARSDDRSGAGSAPPAGTGAGTGSASGRAARAASFSYADSRSIASRYFPASADPSTAACSTAGPIGPISDCGARSLVAATGVGAPFSDSTVTTASPVPSEVSTSARS